MADRMSSQEEPRSENKIFRKHNWRGKLFSANSRLGTTAEKLENTNEDIADFLHTGGTRPEAGPRSAPLAPRVDVTAALSRPSAASVDQDIGVVDVYRRPKPRQNKGLCVRFEPAPPEIIGVGGDEAELPSRDVSRSFADSLRSERSPSQEQSDYDASDQHPEVPCRFRDQYDDTCFQPSSLQRISTGVDDKLLAGESHRAGHDREAFHNAFAGTRKLPSRPRGEQDGQDVASRNTEVRDASYESSAANEKVSHNQSYTRQTVEMRYHGATEQVDVPSPEALPTTSLAPSEPSENLHVSREASLPSYHSPLATRDPQKRPDTGRQSSHQSSQDVSRDSPKDKPLSLLKVAKSPEDESLEDFDSRVRRFNDLFHLIASAHLDTMTVPFERWVRTSAWWFLRGRGGLENAVRAQSSAIAPANAANDGESSSILKQAYFSLAKAWWILKDVIPNLPAIRRFGNVSTNSMVAVIRNFGDKHLAELVEAHLTIYASMRALTMSMKRNGRLPPHHLQMQRLESQIFLETPTLLPEVAALMVNNIFDPTVKGDNHIADPFFPILVKDTPRHFSFCKIFVDVILEYCDDAKTKVHIPCVVSILRERIDWAVKAAVTSQDGQVNLVIQSDEHGGLDWHGVQWNIPLHTMQLALAEDICLQIKFSEKDFKTIWGICDYTQRIRKEYSARRGEEVVYEREVRSVQCFDCPSFPVEHVNECKIRFFERKCVTAEDSDLQEAHAGHRLIVITPPSIKALSKVNFQLEKDKPILFGNHRSKDRNTLLVKMPSSLRVSFTFHEANDVDLFRSILSGTSITEDDHCSASLQLQHFTISPLSTDQDITYMNASRCVSDLGWHNLRIVSRGPPTHGHDSQSIDRLNHTRILADCDFGTFTDRVRTGPGELQLNLSVENLNVITLLRTSQQDATWSFADGVLRESDLSSLSNVLRSMGTSPSVMTYHFRYLPDLHSFQAMLTGFHVLYDGLASTFSISRRWSVVPMHKRWEASTPRLQITRQDKTVQLVAFFKDFSHGACMNFVLKVTDFFETFSRSGGFFLRIVDAKFALPKSESDPARDFLCLDRVDTMPGEHDDVIIGFDSEQGKRLKRLTAQNEGILD